MAHISKTLLSVGFLALVVAEELKTPFPWKTCGGAGTDFGEESSSFNVTHSWQLCFSNMKEILFSPDVEDYAVVINEKLNSLVKTGGGVKLGNGVYPIKSAIVLPSRTCLRGNGTAETILRVQDGTDAFQNKGVIYASKGENISVVALTIDGNREHQSKKKEDTRSGVYFELINYAWFRNVASVRHTHHGFNLHGSDGRHICRAFIEGSKAENNAGVGFKLSSTYLASVFNSLGKYNGHSGIAVSLGATSTMLKRNQLYGNGIRGNGCGIRVYNDKELPPTDTSIVANKIKDSPHAGICLNSTTAVRAIQNKIVNRNDRNAHCFAVSDARSLTVVDTECDVLCGVKYFAGPSLRPSYSNSPTPSTSATLSVSPTPSLTPSASPSAWPSTRFGCYNGIVNYNVCCPAECEVCGNEDCHGDCCTANILVSGRKCEDSGPPCVM